MTWPRSKPGRGPNIRRTPCEPGYPPRLMALLTIVTGSSKGLGEALAKALRQPDDTVVGIARGRSSALDVPIPGVQVEQWSLDLADAPAAAEKLAAWLAAQDPKRYTISTLINNAGVIPQLGPLDDNDAAALSRALRVGLEAAMLLTAVFLRDTRRWWGQRRVLNVSSGLGRRAMAGSAPYCAAKAGLDHFSRAVALDEEHLHNPARIASVAPGIIDTDMQAQLRAADPSRFPEHANFVHWKTAGLLDTPDAAAAKLLDFLARSDFGSNPVTDVRNA